MAGNVVDYISNSSITVSFFREEGEGEAVALPKQLSMQFLQRSGDAKYKLKFTAYLDYPLQRGSRSPSEDDINPSRWTLQEESNPRKLQMPLQTIICGQLFFQYLQRQKSEDQR